MLNGKLLGSTRSFYSDHIRPLQTRRHPRELPRPNDVVSEAETVLGPSQPRFQRFSSDLRPEPPHSIPSRRQRRDNSPPKSTSLNHPTPIGDHPKPPKYPPRLGNRPKSTQRGRCR